MRTFTADVHEYVRTAPQPRVVITGLIATITGVRQTWMDYCTWCRGGIEGWTDGGTVRTGLELKRGKHKWFDAVEPTRSRPAVPATCPTCSHPDPLSASVAWRRGPTSWTVQTQDALDVAWGALRAKHPDKAREADGR